MEATRESDVTELAEKTCKAPIIHPAAGRTRKKHTEKDRSTYPAEYQSHHVVLFTTEGGTVNHTYNLVTRRLAMKMY